MTDFGSLLRALSDAGVRWILVGGAAAVAHGSARLTQDVDVVYARDRENLKRLAAALAPLRPYPRGAPPGLPFQWDERTIANGLNFTLQTDLGAIDLLGEIVGGGGYDALLPHSVEITVFGARGHLLALDKLIEVKRAAGRPKDYEAIAELEVIRGRQAALPVVFLPGAGGTADFWRPVSALLPADPQPVLIGWPGFGDAPPDPSIGGLDDLYRWLCARLPAGRFHLVAQSMGGVLAARLAIEQPERVARLVLVATSGGLDVAALGAADWRPEYLRDHPGAPRWFLEDRTDLGARLRAIRAPTLLLWSDADPVSPLAVGRRLAREIPGARLELVPGGTHAFAHERAAEVAALVGPFLAA